MDFEQRPFIAIWEMTRACDLVCRHCRACAVPNRDLLELGTDEGKRLLLDFRAARVPLIVLTGGDPAKRPDLVELVTYGTELGLHVALTPSATPLVTTSLIEALSVAGLKRLAISIDGANAEIHDAFRGVPGSFEEALRILRTAATFGIATQVNTTVHSGTAPALDAMAELVRAAGAVLWSVFFVVPTGRAKAESLPSAERVESLLEQLADIAGRAPFAVKTTAAPHYRRVLMQRKRRGSAGPFIGPSGHAKVRVNDGRGFVFVSHTGDVYPSGFLPVSCGNVRTDDVIDVYRAHPLFRTLRDPDALEGKCGACEYRSVCGGSRARAYGMTGSVTAEDPLCAYAPPGYQSNKPSSGRHRLEVIHD